MLTDYKAGLLFACKLPFPPSVNSLYAGKSRRYKSDTYKSWLSLANPVMSKALRFMKDLPFKGGCAAVYCLGVPDKRVRDAANYEKAVSDLIVKHGIIEDDSLLYPVCSDWDDSLGREVGIMLLERSFRFKYMEKKDG